MSIELPHPHAWPDEVPILEAKHIHRGFYYRQVPDWTVPPAHPSHILGYAPDENCCCLSGWARKVFTGDPSVAVNIGHPFRQDYDCLMEQLWRNSHECFGWRMWGSSRLLGHVNDEPRNSKEDLARVWNKTMADFGYDVGSLER